MPESIGVHYIKNDEIFESKNLNFPQKYEDFIKDIIQKFALKTKKSNIALQLVTSEGNGAYIESQNELNHYLKDGKIKEFKFYIENQDEIKNKEFTNENKLENKDKEFNNLMDNYDETDIDEFVKEVCDNERYEKRIKSENLKLSNNFKNNLEKNLDNILEQNQKFIQKEINTKLDSFTDEILQAHKKNKNLLFELKDELAGIKNNVINISSGLNEFKKILQNGYIINNGINFEQNHIEKIIDIKDSRLFFINDIKIINEGKKSYKNLFFIKDKENSSNEITFFDNSKKMDEYELKISDELKSNNTLDFNMPLNINSAQPGKIYKMIIYVREQDRYISPPLEIAINIIKLKKNNLNKKETKRKINKKIEEKEKNKIIEKAKKIFSALDLVNINIDKREIIKNIIEKNFNKDEVQKWLNEKIKDKARYLFNELKNLKELDFSRYTKEEILNKIIELNFDKDNIIEFYRINEDEKLVNQIYAEFEKDYEVSSFIDKETMKMKIRELTFDKEKINEWFEIFLINSEL